MGIKVILNRKPAKAEKNKGRLIWRYSSADWMKACQLIDDFDWDSVMSQSIDQSWKLWREQFMLIMAESIPNKVIPTRRNLPWLNKSIIRSMKKRNLLFKHAKRSGDYRHYNTARNRTLAQFRLAKRNYFRSLNPKDPKKFWKAIKYLNKSRPAIPTLTQGDNVAYTDSDKANLLNSFFGSCFNTSHPSIDLESPPTVNYPEELLCTESEVYDLLASLDVSKASGQDGISARMLKHTACSITPSLTKLFNLSLQTATIPSTWKKSLVVPIPKNSEMKEPTNYRPISLLPIVSKLLERHVYNVIMNHLVHHNPLTTNQWGFLKGRSTVTSLLYVTDHWLKELEDGLDICAVFFDFRKAFDSVPHLPLMCKVHSLGLDANIVTWINNYLAKRTQAVVVNGSESSTIPVLSGVPQGSVLGPLLFLVYIDDLSDTLANVCSNVNLFADDVLLYHIIAKEADYEALQSAISLIESWSISNFLNFNSSKCKYMVISRKSAPTLPPIQLQLLGQPLHMVESYKYLGLLLSSNMSWSAHIASICGKARQILGLLYRRFYTGATEPNSIKQLYLSLVRPHLEYACQVWDPHLMKDKKRLEGVQKFGLKMASHQWDTSYSDLLQLFDLPTLEERRTHLKLGLLFKIINKLCYLPYVPPFRESIPNLRALHNQQLMLPLARTNAYHYSFFPDTIRTWNSLDSSCITPTSYSSFMNHLNL